jgi:hypothetical protein
MASETTDNNKVQLLFKEFTGVVNSKQQAPFPLEEFPFKDYITIFYQIVFQLHYQMDWDPHNWMLLVIL